MFRPSESSTAVSELRGAEAAMQSTVISPPFNVSRRSGVAPRKVASPVLMANTVDCGFNSRSLFRTVEHGIAPSNQILTERDSTTFFSSPLEMDSRAASTRDFHRLRDGRFLNRTGTGMRLASVFERADV